MSFLLDTDIVSEWVKPRPDPGVIDWLSVVGEDRVFLSVVSLAELRHGIELCRPADDGSASRHGCAGVPCCKGRVLSIDDAVADAWGELNARTLKSLFHASHKQGRRIP